jgi:CBS domain-containing protein
VYHFRAGKQDWMGAGLPTEGTNTQRPRLVDVVRRDVPVCSLGERVGDVRDRAIAAGWDACVVVSPGRVVLGLLRAKELQADPELLVEQVMRPGPSTYRPFVSVAEMRRTMTERNTESSPVTTSDGKLVGLVRKRDVGLRLRRRKMTGRPLSQRVTLPPCPGWRACSS